MHASAHTMSVISRYYEYAFVGNAVINRLPVFLYVIECTSKRTHIRSLQHQTILHSYIFTSFRHSVERNNNLVTTHNFYLTMIFKRGYNIKMQDLILRYYILQAILLS